MSKASLILFMAISFLLPIAFVFYFNRFGPCTGNNVYIPAALVAGAWGIVLGAETSTRDRGTISSAVFPFLWSTVVFPFSLFFAWAGQTTAFLILGWSYRNLHWTSWLLCMPQSFVE